jgi:asparagine synthase (glutamine-hydrolysing)
VVNEAEFRRDLPAILEAMDQPSIDGVNTWFVAKAAREAGLKVALSGLGGDELLAGYPSFEDVPRWVRWLGWTGAIPGLGRIGRECLKAAGIARRQPKATGLFEYGASYPGAYMLRRGLLLPHELNTVLDRETARIGLRRLNPLKRLKQSMTPKPANPIARVAALESANYMRNQLLRDADWAGMAHGLEIRTPLVDFELARSVAPLLNCVSHGAGKAALAKAPSVRLTDAIVKRPKTGFIVPVGRWMASLDRAHPASLGQSSRALAQRVIAAPGFACVS